MNPNLCRQHLGELLRDERTLLEQLQGLLDEERGVIASADLKGLERSTQARQQLITELAGIEEQRRALCTMHGHSSDADGLEKLLQWCDPRSELSAALAACRASAVKCRDMNDRNGLLVGARLQRVDERLQALRGGTNRAATYGPRGGLAVIRGGRELGAV
jgi:flagellar biosynthesis protein FlgN